MRYFRMQFFSGNLHCSLVPTEVWEDQIIEKVEHRTYNEERKVPQVKALYPYSGHGFQMAKDEVLFLLNKSNPDWWSVRKSDGTDGFAPANYVNEIEPRIMQFQMRRPEKVKVHQRVKKIKMVSPTATPTNVAERDKTVKLEIIDSISNRQQNINATYKYLQNLANRRHALLEDTIRLFKFYQECDDFEKWIHDKEVLLGANDASVNVDVAKRKFEVCIP